MVEAASNLFACKIKWKNSQSRQHTVMSPTCSPKSFISFFKALLISLKGLNSRHLDIRGRYPEGRLWGRQPRKENWLLSSLIRISPTCGWGILLANRWWETRICFKWRSCANMLGCVSQGVLTAKRHLVYRSPTDTAGRFACWHVGPQLVNSGSTSSHKSALSRLILWSGQLAKVF